MLTSMGAQVQELEDGLIIDGPTPLNSAVVDPLHDHRIAMSGAIAGLIASDGQPTRIQHSEVACVSYPAFYSDLERLSQ